MKRRCTFILPLMKICPSMSIILKKDLVLCVSCNITQRMYDDEFRNGFAIWERMFSMMYVYYKSAPIPDYEIFPVGLFLGERVLRNSMIGGDAYSQFFMSATTDKDDWEPLKQGLFDRSYAKYQEIYNQAEEYYKHNRRG